MKRYLYPLLAAVLFAACQKTSEEIPQDEIAVVDESEYIQGVAEVCFSDEMIQLIEDDLSAGAVITKAAGLNAAVANLGITSMERLFPYAGEYEGRTRREGLHKWYKVTFDAEKLATKAAGEISSVPGLEIAEPVRKVHDMAIFNDPGLSNQWHYINDGTLSDMHKKGADVNVLPVWQNYSVGSSNVVVAVVDGGIDQQHEDLKPNLIGGYNFVNNNSYISAHSHGTHVAGTIAAVNNNGKGVAGIAGGDAKKGIAGVKLLSCQIFQHEDGDEDGSGSGAAALKWAADNGANIANNSWGYKFKTQAEAAKFTIPASLRQAIDYFIKYAGCDDNGNQKSGSPMKGGVVFFAAGNDSFNTDPICLYEPVVAVGSMAPDYTRAYYSNYGDWVDICAPGGDANFPHGQVYSTLPGNKYGYMQGTSMACPHATGVAALVLSQCGGVGFTAQALKNKILNGVTKGGVSANAKIGNLVNALGAVTYGGTTPPDKVTSATTTVNANNISLTFNVTRDSDDKKAFGYMALAAQDRALVTEAAKTPSSLPSGVKSGIVEVGDIAVGSPITVTVSDLEFDTPYYVAVLGYDYSGNYSQLSPIYSATTKANNPPVIETDYAGDYKIKSHEIVSIRYIVSDPDGHSLTVKVTEGSRAVTSVSLGNDVYQLQFSGRDEDPGKYTASIVATDKYGASTKLVIDYEILENRPPVIVASIPDVYLEGQGEKFTMNLSEYISDPDGENLSWKIETSNSSVVHANVSDGIFYGTSLGFGLTDITITGTDSRGKSVTSVFSVRVKDPKNLVEAYPNPVSTTLNIRTGAVADTKVTIFSESGAKVYEGTQPVGFFKPLAIDMSADAPGQYVLRVEISGKEAIDKKIVKL